MKSFKKCLSLVLAVIMTLACFTAVASAADYDHLPKIYVDGIGSRAVYMADDPEKKPVFFPMNNDLLMENLKNYKSYLQQSVLDLEPDVVYTLAYNVMWDTCGAAALDTDGITPRFNTTIDPCPLDYRGNGEYQFSYDSRLDPVDIAHQLYEYIGWVQEHSGSQRYELVGSSYGTAAVLACLRVHPDIIDDIDSVLLCVPTANGMDFVGELFSGEINTDATILKDYLSLMVGNEDLSLLLSVLLQTGTLDFIVEDAVEPLVKAAALRAAKDIIHDIFATFPSMWSFVNDDYFYAALEYIYGENYADPDHEYAGLISKVTYYHEEVMMKSDEIFASLDAKNVHKALLVKYNKPILPLNKEGNVLSDNIVTVEDASYGAISSRYGDTLPADYQQKLYTDYDMVSPDNCIDASTGAMPFNTWYIKGLEHQTRTNGYYELMNAVVYENLDIHKNEKYPQFLTLAEDGDSLVPLEETEPEEKLTFVQQCILLLRRAFEFIIGKITEFFSK